LCDNITNGGGERFLVSNMQLIETISGLELLLSWYDSSKNLGQLNQITGNYMFLLYSRRKLVTLLSEIHISFSQHLCEPLFATKMQTWLTELVLTLIRLC
jgi:hypothetical protein